jgi:transposase-like protein
MGGDSKNRHESIKIRNEDGHDITPKAPILGMIVREGNVIAKHVPDTKEKTLFPIIFKNVNIDTILITDNWRPYKKLRFCYHHFSVNHSAKEYVNGMVHTNNIECFWSHLKHGVDGIYHWVSEKRLQSYVEEYSLRFNTR